MINEYGRRRQIYFNIFSARSDYLFWLWGFKMTDVEKYREAQSKRHCWSHDKVSDVYECGFVSGFDFAITYQEERANKLIVVLEFIRNKFLVIGEPVTHEGLGIAIMIDKALSEYRGEK